MTIKILSLHYDTHFDYDKESFKINNYCLIYCAGYSTSYFKIMGHHIISMMVHLNLDYVHQGYSFHFFKTYLLNLFNLM